jgi:hypothetical protein
VDTGLNTSGGASACVSRTATASIRAVAQQGASIVSAWGPSPSTYLWLHPSTAGAWNSSQEVALRGRAQRRGPPPQPFVVPGVPQILVLRRDAVQEEAVVRDADQLGHEMLPCKSAVPVTNCKDA